MRLRSSTAGSVPRFAHQQEIAYRASSSRWGLPEVRIQQSRSTQPVRRSRKVRRSAVDRRDRSRKKRWRTTQQVRPRQTHRMRWHPVGQLPHRLWYQPGFPSRLPGQRHHLPGRETKNTEAMAMMASRRIGRRVCNHRREHVLRAADDARRLPIRLRFPTPAGPVAVAVAVRRMPTAGCGDTNRRSVLVRHRQQQATQDVRQQSDAGCTLVHH